MDKPNREIPAEAGVYALIHRKSGTCFVGSSGNLRRRHAVWRSVLGRGEASKLRRGFPDHPREEWEFKVVAHRLTMTTLETGTTVDATIAKAQKQGLVVLNRIATPSEPAAKPAWDARAYHLRQMPVPILDDFDGQPITYAEAADKLGRSLPGLKVSAKRLRDAATREGKPLTSIKLSELRATR